MADQQHEPEILRSYKKAYTEALEAGDNELLYGVSPPKLSNYLSHLHMHLNHEYFKNPKALPEFIRFRQILEHSELTRVDGSRKHNYVLSLLKKVWMQDLFNRFLDQFQKKLFDPTYKAYPNELKQQIAELYLFQLHTYREFIEEGNLLFEARKKSEHVPLSKVMMLSDEALYEVLEARASQFQFPDNEDPRFKAIPNFNKYREKYDLLKSFDCSCKSNDAYADRNKLYKDIKYLLDLAVDLYEKFQKDMDILVGSHYNSESSKLACNIKVDKKGGLYKVTGVRRILAKWVETLLDDDKELIQNPAFHAFIADKKKVFDNFYIQSGDMIEPTHELIINILLQVLVQSVFQPDHEKGSGQLKQNEQFGLYIYDLLRCKIKVDSIDKIKQIIGILENPPIKTGQKIELFRVKNRLATHNRDVMVNFKYGGIIAAEMQIGLSEEHVADKAKLDLKHKQYNYKHFLYELSRSIFGPTMELIILYEDATKQNQIKTNMESKGEVSLRSTSSKKGIVKTSVKCPSGHQMLCIQSGDILKDTDHMCRWCFRNLSKEYLYCYKCTITYCQSCYRMFVEKRVKASEEKTEAIKIVDDPSEFKDVQGYVLVMLHLSYSPASNIMYKFLKQITEQMKNDKVAIRVLTIDKSQKALEFANQAEVKRFPAFLMYKADSLKKRIIGGSIYKIYDILQVMRIEKNSKKCPEDHQLIEMKPMIFLNWRCNECFADRRRPEEKIHFCKECLYICCEDCSFSKQVNTKVYEDSNGVSYLSSALPVEQRVLCLQNHIMELSHECPDGKGILQNCSKCSEPFYFISEFGVYTCKICKSGDGPTIYCNSCSGSYFSTLIDRKEFANHEVQSYVTDFSLCGGCKRPYKLCNSDQWRCTKCKLFHENKLYHLSCETCKVKICSTCKADILDEKKQNDLNTFKAHCGQCNHQLILAEDELTENFKCCQCDKLFYPKSAHFKCNNCESKREQSGSRYCESCVRSTKIKIKMCVYKQNKDNKMEEYKKMGNSGKGNKSERQQNNQKNEKNKNRQDNKSLRLPSTEKTQVREYEMELPSSTNLDQLLAILKKKKILEDNASGDFKRSTESSAETLKHDEKVQPNQVLHFFETPCVAKDVVLIMVANTGNNPDRQSIVANLLQRGQSQKEEAHDLSVAPLVFDPNDTVKSTNKFKATGEGVPPYREGKKRPQRECCSFM